MLLQASKHMFVSSSPRKNQLWHIYIHISPPPTRPRDIDSMPGWITPPPPHTYTAGYTDTDWGFQHFLPPAGDSWLGRISRGGGGEAELSFYVTDGGWDICGLDGMGWDWGNDFRIVWGRGEVFLKNLGLGGCFE